jgi:PEP-CTERM motif-containing protein
MNSHRIHRFSAQFTAVFGALVFLAPSSALAGPLWYKSDGMAANDAVNISYGSFSGGAYTGQNIGQLSTSSDFSASPQFYTFCVDLDHEVQSGQVYQVDPESLTDPLYGRPNGAQIAYLYSTYGTSQITNNDYAAALQLALWDEVANGGTAPTIGSPLQYTVSAAITAQVQTFLNLANANAGTGIWADPVGPGITDPPPAQLGQGFLIPTGGPNVPEPSTLTLAAIGATGIAWLARRHAPRRRHATIACG